MLGGYLGAKEYFEACAKTFRQIDFSLISGLSEEVYAACEERRGIFVCGNGLAGSTATRFCNSLTEKFEAPAAGGKRSGTASKVMSLSDRTAALFADPGEEGFERILAMLLGKESMPDDLVIFLSVDGECSSLVQAAEWAAAHGRRTWGLAGHPGGRLRTAVRTWVRVPLTDPEIVHLAHHLVLRWVLEDVLARTHRVGRYMEDRVVASL